MLLRQRPLELPAFGEPREHPVVERTMVLELERADRVRDPFERVGDAVRVVVERIDAPFVAGAMMRGVPDPVDRRIAHVDVRARHVDLEPQHVRAVRKLAGLHPPEEIQVLGDAAIAIDARLPRFGQRPAQRAHFLRRRALDVREPLRDEPLGEFVETLVVVGRVVAKLPPVESEPAHRLGDRILELDVLLDRIRVVIAQMALAVVFGGEAEIEDDRLRVSVVKISVGLGRKPRDDPPAVLAGPVVLGDDRAQEIRCRRARPCGSLRRRAASGERFTLGRQRSFFPRCSTHRRLFMNNLHPSGILTGTIAATSDRAPLPRCRCPETRAK